MRNGCETAAQRVGCMFRRTPIPTTSATVVRCACVLRRPAEIEALRICSGGLRSVGGVTEPCGVSGNTHIDFN
ncbi:Hypothetical protein SMAX5B_006841 [Scophthalmus maximus]|uniref:Uncharacterized protein n=1 Tax=Scophthalmus maximus TaxID=52904 RepID=A0A2U9AWU4_SCOMX|nr:Hypothetical protein SMAX5B_006841 [Scophthalmus maximus]